MGCSILEGVVAYVDIRSPLGGAISALTRSLATLGAIVMSTRNSSVTHVIFRKGDPDTKYWAEKRGIFIVTPAWVTACSKEKIRVPEACYYIKEKEDVELENDFKMIAMKNASLATPALQNDSIISGDLTVNISLLTIPETLTVSKTFLDDSAVNQPPSASKRYPPPGWKCLPSPQQPNNLMSLSEYPSSMSEPPRPHIEDIKRMPLSPDVVNSVVYNMATSVKWTKKAMKKPRRALTPPFKSAVVTPKVEKDIVRKSLSLIKSTKNRKFKPRSTSFRKELLKKISKSKPRPSASFDTVKEPVKLEKTLKTRIPTESQPSRKSKRLSVKANTIVIDSEISLNSSTMNISSSELRNSLEDFIEHSSVKQRRQTRSNVQTRDPPIEILFSGLNSFQRQTLITLLRSCPSLSRHEINPSINERLCGVESVNGKFSATSSHSTAAVVAAVLGSSSEEDLAAARRWRLTDRFVPSSTTHLVTCRDASASSISHSCPRTVNLFKALMDSVPVVDQSWIEESAKAAKWLPHQPFLVSGLPSSETAAAEMRTLFSKVGDIFLASGTSPPSNVLKDLIIAGGGSVSRRPFGATLVVGQFDVKRPSVTPKWILESILHCRPQPYDKFRILE